MSAMTTTDPQMAAQAIMARLTGPGGDFEVAEEAVLGTRMPVFANRENSLADVLASSVEHGSRDYIVTATERVSFAEHARRVSSLATALRAEYGVAKGDRVAIAAANSPEWIVAFWATVSIGGIVAGFNAWWSHSEMDYGVGHAQPKVIVCDEKRVSQIDPGDATLLTVERDIPRLAGRYPDASLPSVELAEDDPAVIMYSSGTSGRPKGALHSHRNLVAVIGYHRLNDALAAEFGDPTDPRDKRYLLALPLFHIASLHNLAVPRLANGSTIVMHQGKFDVDTVLRLIESERVTSWGAVPTMAHRLIKHGDLSGYDLSSLRAFALASAPSSPEFKEKLTEVLPAAKGSLVDSYGLTETGTAVAVATPMDLAENPGTLGRPIIGVEMEIRDENGDPLPEGQEGEVCVRSQYTMLGYWGDPDATAEAIKPGRWLHTGDIGTRQDGKLWLTARRSDLILRGGENVYPAEIENVLAQHPGVEECIVLPSPHADLGHEVAAVVVTSPEAAPSEAELAEFARARLAYFKVPSVWRLITEPLPRNATGKIKRREVSVDHQHP